VHLRSPTSNMPPVRPSDARKREIRQAPACATTICHRAGLHLNPSNGYGGQPQQRRQLQAVHTIWTSVRHHAQALRFRNKTACRASCENIFDQYPATDASYGRQPFSAITLTALNAAGIRGDISERTRGQRRALRRARNDTTPKTSYIVRPYDGTNLFREREHQTWMIHDTTQSEQIGRARPQSLFVNPHLTPTMRLRRRLSSRARLHQGQMMRHILYLSRTKGDRHTTRTVYCSPTEPTRLLKLTKRLNCPREQWHTEVIYEFQQRHKHQSCRTSSRHKHSPSSPSLDTGAAIRRRH